MTKSRRDYIKRDLAHAMYDTVIAMQHLGKVYDVVLPQHPELAEKLLVCLQGYEIIAGVLKGFAQAITGRDDINWEGWRAITQAQKALQEPIDPVLAHLYTSSKRHPLDIDDD
jgi:hypothetical protein